MFWYDNHMSPWAWAGMGIGMVLFWAFLIAGIVALIMYATGDRGRPQPPPQPTSAEQILAARFAHGEISDTEYRDRLTALRDQARP
jgi:putative membrane protein